MPQGNPLGYLMPEGIKESGSGGQALVNMIASMLQGGGGNGQAASPQQAAPQGGPMVQPPEPQMNPGHPAVRQQGQGQGQPAMLAPEEVEAVVAEFAGGGAGPSVEAEVMQDDPGSKQHRSYQDSVQQMQPEQEIADAVDTGDGPSTGGTYTVKQGDNLWNIAERMLGDPQMYVQIAQMNGIEDPNMIQPGMQLQMPSPMPERNPNAA